MTSLTKSPIRKLLPGTRRGPLSDGLVRFLMTWGLLLYGPFLIPSWEAQAYELVFIHAVSSSKKTFVIRLGKANGIVAGTEGTFFSPYLGMVAKAETVTREFSQWRVMEPGAEIPFEKNQIVIYHGSTEGIWSNDPDAYLFLMANNEFNNGQQQSHLRDLLDQTKDKHASLFNQTDIPKVKSISLKAAFSKGITHSVSLANSAQITSRFGQHFTAIYEWELFSKFFLGLGLRYDQEIVESPTITVTSNRYYGLFDVSYHFFSSAKTGQSLLYIGSTFGLGISRTQVATENLVGTAEIFPSFRAGTELPLPSNLTLQIEGSAESVSIKESFTDGDQQTTNEVNGKLAVGLKKYF